MPVPTLVVFGPQTSWPNAEYLGQMRDALRLEPRNHFILDTIKKLPELWDQLLRKDPLLNSLPGKRSVQLLQDWINGEEVSLASVKRPNILTLPLTIITHFVQYFYYIDNDTDYPSQSRLLKSVELGGMQGFCAGILTAVAVSCSKNEEDINIFGATALRLAFCIGAYVDLDSALNIETVSLVIRWRSKTGSVRF